MAKNSGESLHQGGDDELFTKIIVGAGGDDEQLRAFQQVISDEVCFPCPAFVMGQPVTVLEITYDGNARRGLTARCRRRGGTEYLMAAADVLFPAGSNADSYLAGYRNWLGLAPFPQQVVKELPQPAQQTAVSGPDLSDSLELLVFSTRKKMMRCRQSGSDHTVTFRPSRWEDLVPGEIITVTPRKSWNHKGHAYLSGEIMSIRLDVTALDLVPLELKSCGIWKPADHYWGEEGEPIEEWAKPIIARGVRPSFKMEQVLPGVAPDDYDTDPISNAAEEMDSGNDDGALKILMELCQSDLRCLDAHSHLGNMHFDRIPEIALRHYNAGLRIGELSLGDDFEGLLPWGHIDNRPFLRCMHGYGLCLWRLGRLEDALRIFERMLWLNPSDNQGARFLVDDLRKGIAWDECQDR